MINTSKSPETKQKIPNSLKKKDFISVERAKLFSPHIFNQVYLLGYRCYVLCSTGELTNGFIWTFIEVWKFTMLNLSFFSFCLVLVCTLIVLTE